MHFLSVLVHERHQPGRIVGDRDAGHHAHARMCLQPQPDPQRRHWIQSGVERGIWCLASSGNISGLNTPPGQHLRPVALHGHITRIQGNAARGHEVGCPNSTLALRARLALEDQTGFSGGMGLHEQFRKRRVGFISPLRRQCQLQQPQHFEVGSFVSEVVQVHQPQFHRLVRTDTDLHACLPVGAAGVKFHPVFEVAGLIAGIWMAARRQGDGVKAALPRRPQHDPMPTPIPQQIVLRTVDHKTVPLALTSAVGAQIDTVLTVAQQGGGHVGRSGAGRVDHPDAGLQMLGTGLLQRSGNGARLIDDFTGQALLHQRLSRMGPGRTPEPAPWRPHTQQVAQAQQAHALVMGHVGEDSSPLTTTVQSRCAEIERFDESQPVARTTPLQRPKVVQCTRQIHHQREHTGIGRNDQVLQRRAPQGQLRHAKRTVLKSELVVLLEEGAFRDTPGHPQVLTKMPLRTHG